MFKVLKYFLNLSKYAITKFNKPDSLLNSLHYLSSALGVYGFKEIGFLRHILTLLQKYGMEKMKDEKIEELSFKIKKDLKRRFFI